MLLFVPSSILLPTLHLQAAATFYSYRILLLSQPLSHQLNYDGKDSIQLAKVPCPGFQYRDI